MKHNFPKLSLLLSVVLLAFSSFLFLFLYTKINSNNNISEQMRIEWQTEAQRQNDMKSLEESILVISEERALLETHFAQSSDVVPFLDMIEKLAKDGGAKAEVVLVDLSKDNMGLVVQIEATGNFRSVYKFLTLLENSPYELEVMSMDMKKLGGGDPNDKNSKTTQWSAVLQVELLSFVK